MPPWLLLSRRFPCSPLPSRLVHSYCCPRLLPALRQRHVPAPRRPGLLRRLLPRGHVLSERWRSQRLCLLALPCRHLWPGRGLLCLHPLPQRLLLLCPGRHLPRHVRSLPAGHLHAPRRRLQPQGLRHWPGLCVPPRPAALLAQHPRLCGRLRAPGLRAASAGPARRLWLQRLRRWHPWSPWRLQGLPQRRPVPRPPLPPPL